MRTTRIIIASTVVLVALVAGKFLSTERLQTSAVVLNTATTTASPQDLAEAESLLQKAEQYERGDGVHTYRLEAGPLYIQAARRGSKTAQDRLVTARTKCSSNHQPDGGTVYDLPSCFVASATGDPSALHAVGIAYLAGQGGLPQDKLKAFDWLMKAARAGSSMAAIHLAIMYDQGDGIPQDLVEAVAWFTVAKDRQDLPELSRKAVKVGMFSAVGKLTFKQIHEANLKAINYQQLITKNQAIKGDQ